MTKSFRCGMGPGTQLATSTWGSKLSSDLAMATGLNGGLPLYDFVVNLFRSSDGIVAYYIPSTKWLVREKVLITC